MSKQENEMVQVDCIACIAGECETCGGTRKVSWPKKDLEWLQKLSLPLQRAALRHGRSLFSLVMRAGACNHAAGILYQGLRQEPTGLAAAVTLAKAADECFIALLEARGQTVEQFQACMRDVELVAQLAGASAGGDVLVDAGRLQ